MEFFKNRFQLPKIDIPGWKLQGHDFLKYKFPKLKIGDLTAEIPVIQGGMGVGISLSGLAAAAANAGAVGIVAANAIGMLEPDFFKNGKEANVRALRKELRKTREKTQGIIGVNIMVAGNDFYELLQVCIQEKADLVILGAGLPIKDMPVKALREANVKVLPIVSSHRAARLIFKYWQDHYQDIPDGVVVEGPKAGGHLGFAADKIHNPDFSLEKIFPPVVETIAEFEKQSGRQIPVIAAGGIDNGEDIYRFLKLGAKGVQMGTRFVATDECDADIRFKETYVNCKKEDIIIIESPVGLPGRAVNGPFFNKAKENKRDFTNCPWKCLKICNAQHARYCIALALDYARKGNLQKGFVFAGANAYKIDKIIPVKELVGSLQEEFKTVLERNTLSLREEYEKALVKLADLKKEYGKTVDNALAVFRKKYEDVVTKSFGSLREEYPEFMNKISALKTEYEDYADRLRCLVHQLHAVPATETPG